MDDTNPRQIARRLLNHAALLVVIFISPLFSSAVSAQSLPPGWSVADVGSPAIQGYATYSNQTFTVSGAGSGIGGATDQFTIAYRQLTGDGTIVARVGALPAIVPGAHAGVMIRQELSAGAAHASVLVSRSDGITFTRRRSGGGGTSNTAAGSGTSAVWVRVDRRSSTVTASYSADGSTWTLLGTDTVTMNNVLYVGLAVSSRLTVAAVQATFTGVQVTSLVEYGGPLPAGWSSQDLGAPGQPGAAAYDAGTFGLVGGGSNIGGTWDQFRFAYGQVTADVDIVARVRDLGNTNAFSKAGVMIRDSLTPNGAHASMFVTASGTTLFRRRPSGGQGSVDTSGPSNQAPVWLKLSLRNGVVSGYQSLDGVSWALVGTQTLTLPTPYYVGLAVTSADNAATVTTNIDNVQVTAAANAAPTVALTEPASGSTYVEPATIVISANASDTDGTVTRVDFFQGTTLIGSDTTSPYSFTWTNVPAGTYSLTARATDDDGATTTSSARFVTVNLNPNQPPSVAVTAPASGSTYTAPASITINATASDTDGTITRVDFFQGTTVIGSDTTSPYSFTWTNVPAGTYSLTARATDDDGATTTSAAVFVTVNQPANQAPTVALTAPANGATFTEPASITIDATASDADGTVTRVDFFQGTTQIGSDTTSPYSFTWTNVPAGTYSLTARATDNGGAVTTSAPRTVTVTAAGLPAGWTAADVGNPTPAGRTSFANGTYSITAGGADIFGTADQFQFAYRQVSGDFDVVARVATLGQTNDFSKAGVMIRESLNGNAANAAMVVTARQGFRFTGRLTTGATTASTASGTNQAPVWVKLSLRGATVTGYQSLDGTTWTQVGTDTLTLPATYYIGLAVTSHDTAATVDATLDNVVVQAVTSNQPPTVSLTAPANGATYTAPASITIDATAGDTDGTVTRVDFFQGTTLLGSDTTSPYSFTWNNVPAGTYSLTAQAVDDDGATTMSAARTVTVNPPANQPPSVALTAPANGATYMAPASITIDATASDTDGTVTRVDFFQGTTLLGSDTTSPYSFTWSNVPAGTYSLTARATDNAGAVTTSAARTVTVTSGGLPAGWTAADVGNPTPAGRTSFANGTYSVTGGGADIFGTADQFHFAYQQVSGDIDVVARVATLGQTNAFSKAGVMIRESLAGNAANAAMVVTPAQGLRFTRRTSAGATTASTVGGSNQPPVWVKLSRRGGTITSFSSVDGTTWTQVGTDTLTLPATFYVGLAVTSHDTAATVDATLDNVLVQAVTSNQPPTVSLTAPANGATYTAPASITIDATASDTDGTVTRVDFFQGATLLGSDTTSPYSFTWNNVPAGTYSLTAQAVDDDGAATMSAARTVTVNPPANQAPTVALTAPANGATYTAPASITIDATASDTDGTVTRVDFFQGTTLLGSDTTSPYSFTWSNVPAGTYSLTARATDNAGAVTTSAARTVTVTAGGLPAGWTAADVGNPTPAGRTSFANGTFSVTGGGADIFGTADQFHFAYQQVSGDIDVVARVATLGQTNAFSKAGVMIRESLAGNAANAAMVVTPVNGLRFTRRSTAGATTASTTGGSNQPPVWVKLSRRGGTITSFSSVDGTTWTQVGTDTLTLPATFYVGLAVTSHDAAATVDATLDNVLVQAPGPNQAPTVSLTAPANGATYTAPASITIDATAADTDGAVTRVDFFQGTTLIGSDTTSPYSFTWTNVPAGTYSLTARATDNAGATTTSAARSVTVNPAAPQTRTAVFNPSPDHNTLVNSYLLEIFAAGANPATATPIATQNLGKPAIVNGECSADVTATINALAAGNYQATVSAVGSGGSSRSAAVNFTR